MSLLIQASRGLKWQAIELFGRQVLSLAVFTSLARLLDPSAFGLIGLVGVYLAFVTAFVDQGLPTALIQRKELEAAHLNAAFWFNIACASLICVGTIALAVPIAEFLHEPRLVPLLRWCSLALVINAAAAVQNALFIRAMDFRRPAIRTFVANLCGGAVGLGMALRGYGVWALVGQELTSCIGGTVFLWLASEWQPSFSMSIRHLRELMRVSSSVFATSLLWFVSSRLDQVVIGRVAGSSTLGQYVMGTKLPELARTAIHKPLSMVSLPALSQVQHDYGRMRNVIYKGMELNATITFAVFGGLAAVAPSLVPLVFGSQWRPAIPLLQLLALYNLALGLSTYIHPALLASGGPGRYVLVNVVCATGVFVACSFGIRLGVPVLIVGLLLNIIFVVFLGLLFLRSRIALVPWMYLRPCVVPCIAGALMYAAVLALQYATSVFTYQWYSLAAQVVTGAVVYIGTTLLLAPGSVSRVRHVLVHAMSSNVQAA